MITKEQITAVLADTKRPAVHILPVFNHTDHKFGGAFSLLNGVHCPEMELLAQINLSEIPHLENFPETGLLQFFLCINKYNLDKVLEESVWKSDSGLFKIFYRPEIPKEIINEMHFVLIEEIATLTLSETGFESDLGFQSATERVFKLFQEDFAQENQKKAIGHNHNYGYDLTLCSDTDRFCADFGNWGCKLGGHPALRGRDIRLENQAYRRYSTLLFQFDQTSLNPDNPCFLEGRTLCFFIKPEDLASCRFDDILLFQHDCY